MASVQNKRPRQFFKNFFYSFPFNAYTIQSETISFFHYHVHCSTTLLHPPNKYGKKWKRSEEELNPLVGATRDGYYECVVEHGNNRKIFIDNNNIQRFAMQPNHSTLLRCLLNVNCVIWSTEWVKQANTTHAYPHTNSTKSDSNRC